VTDQSLIIELLELQAHLQGEAAAPAAARYHFEDIGGVQGARAAHVLSVQPHCLKDLSPRGCCQDAWVLPGKQQVAKDAALHQALLRPPQDQTDLLLTFSQSPPPPVSVSLQVSWPWKSVMSASEPG
jgi:hypothetical protein